MTKKRVVDFLLALTGGAIALVGYFYLSLIHISEPTRPY